VTPRPNTHTKTPLREGFLRSFVRWLITGVVLIWALAALMLVAARWIDPPTTAVHIQRRLQAWIHHAPYHERYKFIPRHLVSEVAERTAGSMNGTVGFGGGETGCRAISGCGS
jgi:monofunctional biosynthetic peptidoglycan transglycosylase